MSTAPSEPTDLELMMLLDGELDGERRAEVEAFLAESGDEEGAAARGKLSGLRAVSRVVSTFDWPAAKAATVDVADRVMAALPAELTSGASGEPAAEGAPVRAVATSPAPKAHAANQPRAVAKKPATETPLPVSSRPAANDNSRAIFGFAIAAAAAAAALFFWGKTGDEPKVGGADPIAMSAPPPGPDLLGDVPAPLGTVGDLNDELAKTEPADDPRYGVEVASVDFGARSGAIYYVPATDLEGAAGKAAVTTVVWLNDD